MAGALGSLNVANVKRVGLRFSLIGCSALLVEAPGQVDPPLQQRILALTGAVRDWPEVAEPVPGVGNLMLVLADPAATDPETLVERIAGIWPDLRPLPLSGRVIEVPVIYGGELATDLASVCAQTGFGLEELARIHAAPDYTVASVASAPGFGYLMGMDPRIAVPRKTVPSLNVPKGAVTIGGRQSGISVSHGPNGWNAIGHTDLLMFDPDATPPSMMRPGDVVRFSIQEIVA
ncbi:MAG: 5-oxoprolinase subunit PxpB [Tropicimonas sp.]|uniref:5-oxoprolinase subunit PxpB n=1 Tax=Tropicimonas sp. TaxID=2067044 RepID=UPI003A8936C9